MDFYVMSNLTHVTCNYLDAVSSAGSQLHVVSKLLDVQTNELQPVSLECILSQANQAVTWFKDDQQLASNDHTVIGADRFKHRLDISHCSLADAGKYAMKTGNVQSSCNVTISGYHFLSLD